MTKGASGLPNTRVPDDQTYCCVQHFALILSPSLYLRLWWRGAGAVVAVNFLWVDLLFFFSQIPQLSTDLTLVDLLGVTSCKEGREIRLIWSEITFRYNLRYEHFHTEHFRLFQFLPNIPLNLLYIWHHICCYL